MVAIKTSGTQAGQTLVLFVFALAALSGFTAMTVDVGLILHERRQLQNAADAAALAGAQELSDSTDAAVAEALEYAAVNGVDLIDPDYTIDVTTSYEGDPNLIEVSVSHNVGFIFGRVLGLDITTVTARAVGEINIFPGGPGDAIFVMNSSCAASDPMIVSGSGSIVIGGVHSNSSIEVSGSDSAFQGDLTYRCDFQDNGANNTFDPLPQLDPGPPPDSPIDYTYAEFPCDVTWTGEDVDLGSKNEVWVNDDPDTNELKPGVYCSDQDIQLSGQFITGEVTLVAMDEVKIAGSDFNISARWNDVLAFSAASHDSAIDISGSGGFWSGFIHAPNGRVKMQGQQDLSIAGSIVADRVTVSGSNFSVTAPEEGGASDYSVRLSE